ncbi:MAG: HlyD family secretion protein [Roseiarcus sp.]
MSRVELKANGIAAVPAIKRGSVLSSVHALPVLATLVAVALAALLGWGAWQYYMGTPWTRDGAVRAYVVKVAPQVAGEIVKLPIADNQFVHKGDLLMLIDPRNYSIAVRQAQASVEQAQAVADNARAEMIRREKLNDLSVTMEERQTYISQATTAEANYQTALANLEQARINFKRTQVRSPVNGYVTNLSAQLGNYANVGSLQLSLVNSDSYWIDAYFEETALSRIHEGDAATIKLMGYTPLLRGRVQGLARGIDVPNAAPDASGLASVNPIFTFVRLAQRVPVRIHIDEVPDDVKLVAGMTATVQIEPYKAPPIADSKPASAKTSQADVQPASFQTLADATSQTAPPDAAKPPATTPAPPVQPANPPATQGAQPQPAVPAASPAAQPTTASAANQLSVSAQPSPQAAAAADAAAADLKTLQEQIAANPPSGASSGKSDGGMPSNEYLGQTYDLYGNPSATPAKPRSPNTIRRRARSRWRHLPPRSPSP